jgi:hypothetical protein
MAARDTYKPTDDAIVGGVLMPGRIQGRVTLNAALLSDQLFASMWPPIFAQVVAAFDLGKAPIEAVTAAATEATWAAVDEALGERAGRSAAAAAREKLRADGAGSGGN